MVYLVGLGRVGMLTWSLRERWTYLIRSQVKNARRLSGRRIGSILSMLNVILEQHARGLANRRCKFYGYKHLLLPGVESWCYMYVVGANASPRRLIGHI